MKYKITSNYADMEGFRQRPHTGIDFKMQIGEPIRSIKSGVATIHDYGNVNAGKTIFIKWEDGKTAIYGHLNDFTVKNGQHVNTGDLLGHAGNTGFSTGSHLHFGLKEGGRYLDPSPYISDIQNMNVKQFVQQTAPDVAQLKVNFFDYMQQHMSVVTESLTELKVHLIDFIL